MSLDERVVAEEHAEKRGKTGYVLTMHGGYYLLCAAVFDMAVGLDGVVLLFLQPRLPSCPEWKRSSKNSDTPVKNYNPYGVLVAGDLSHLPPGSTL